MPCTNSTDSATSPSGVDTRSVKACCSIGSSSTAKSSVTVRGPRCSPSQGGATEGDDEASAARGAAGEGVQACANAEAVLRLLGRLVQDRTEAQWRVVDALRRLGTPGQGQGRHGSQKHVASELGISEQSVSRTVIRSGWQEEWAARPAASMLLGFADSRVGAPPQDAPGRKDAPAGQEPADRTEGDR